MPCPVLSLSLFFIYFFLKKRFSPDYETLLMIGWVDVLGVGTIGQHGCNLHDQGSSVEALSFPLSSDDMAF